MIKAWQTALQVKRFRIKIIIVCFLLAFCALIAPCLFQFIQMRDGHLLNDFLLSKLPAFDLSIWIFTLLYFLIITSIVVLSFNPQRFLLALHAYVILTILRYATILLIPLEPPVDMVELIDPFVSYFFYQETITKDLFFSGHTSILVLLALSTTNRHLKIVLYVSTVAIGSMLLLQHVHYSIDVFFAPFFSWLALAFTKKIS